MFDLYLLPIHLIGHQEQPDLAGFLAVNAPRRVARNRMEDSCIIFLNLQGSALAIPAMLEKYCQKLADDYYRTAGSVTAGVRSAVENLNEFLLKYNLENARTSQTVSGVLNMAILHNDQLFIVHAGSAHSLVVSQSGVEDYQDTYTEHGLGVSHSTTLHYYQTQMQETDILFFWNNMPPEFSANLQMGLGKKNTLEQFRRHVLSLVGSDERLVLVQFRTGKGQLHLLKPRLGQKADMEDGGHPGGEMPTAEGIKPHESVDIKFEQPPVGLSPQTTTDPQPTTFYQNVPEKKPALNVEEQLPEANKLVLDEKPESGTDNMIPITPETQNFVAPLKPRESVQLTPDEPGSPRVEKPPLLPKVQDAPIPARETAENIKPLPKEKPTRNEQKNSRANWLDKVLALIPGREAKEKPRESDAAVKPSVPEEEIAMQPVAMLHPEEPGNDQPGISIKGNGVGGNNQKEKNSLRRWLAAVWLGGRAARLQVDQNGKKILTSVLPGDPPAEGLRLSPAMMLFIAIAVPLLVVSMATTIYFRNGPGKQFQTYLAQAQIISDQAKKQSDLDLKRKNWIQIINLLDKAEMYGISDESRTLRTQVQQALDTIDGITRQQFQPISITLDSAVQISRMAANVDEVYSLDASQGRVVRLFRTGQGYNYSFDPSFVCGPGMVGSNLIDRLVGMALLPQGNPTKASVLAMDKNGNLLFCTPGSQPLASVLPPPEKKIPLGDVVNFKLDGESLYVLDVKNNAIYIYLGNNLGFTDPPHLYFDLEIPNLINVADMVFNGNDLFLLHEDGNMTKCTFRQNRYFQTHCIDPSPYQDTRPGREGQTKRFTNTHFTQIQATDPPDPSLFILDEMSSTLFQFGLSQTLHSQVRMQIYPDFTLPTQPASAFTIGSNRVIWIAYGNEVFFTPQ